MRQELSATERKQLEILRAKTPEQRFDIMADLIAAQFESMKAGIQFQNPGAGEAEINRLFKERLRKTYSLKP